jgi:hypothetical protein
MNPNLFRIGSITTLLLLLWLGMSLMDEPDTQPARRATHTVTYRATGIDTSMASLTYENEQGGTEQHLVRVPWSASFTATSGQFLYLSVQNDSAHGSITCEILVDGLPFKKSHSTAEYGIAGCSGAAPR